MKTTDSKLEWPLKRKGFALVIVMAFAAILAVFTAAVGAQAALNLRLAEKRSEADRAYYAAQTGTQLILALLREPPPILDYNGDGTPGNWIEEDASVRLRTAVTRSDSIARVYHNIEGFGNAQAIASDGTEIPPNHFYIVSMGVVNGVYDSDGNLQDGTRYDAATMGATLNPDFPIMPQAIFGYEQVDVDGVVAHFDSSDPPTWTIKTGNPPTGNHMESRFPEASVGINLPDESSVVIGENAEIDGHVLLGFGATPANLTTLANNIGDLPGGSPPPVATTFLYGQTGVAQPGIGSPPNGPNVSGAVDALGSTRSILDMEPDPDKVEQTFPAGPGGTLNLQEGKVYVKLGDLTLTGTDTINVLDTNGDGEIEDVVLLVENNISFDGVSIGANGATPPRNLKIYSLGSGSTFTMNGSTVFALIAGAEMAATIGDDSILWGAVMGREVTLEAGSAVHYDVTLRDPTLIADIYGYYLVGATVSPGAGVPPGDLGPVGDAAPAPAPAPGDPAPAPTGGCGCGCGSMLVMEKV